jgi:hypothetical protein
MFSICTVTNLMVMITAIAPILEMLLITADVA